MPHVIGARLRELRIAAGLSQQDVASQVGVTKARVSQWETDAEAGIDSRKRLDELAKALGVEGEDLLVPPRFTPPARVARRTRAGAVVVPLPIRVPPELLGRQPGGAVTEATPVPEAGPSPLAGLTGLQQAALDMYCKACLAGVIDDQMALRWLNEWHAQLTGRAGGSAR